LKSESLAWSSDVIPFSFKDFDRDEEFLNGFPEAGIEAGSFSTDAIGISHGCKPDFEYLASRVVGEGLQGKLLSIVFRFNFAIKSFFRSVKVFSSWLGDRPSRPSTENS
jgi:hypothetical protein